MKILALPSRLTLALDHLLELAAAGPRTARERTARELTAPTRHTARHTARSAAVGAIAVRVPALHAAYLSDADLRMVARPHVARPAPRLGRTWAVRVGTGHRAIGRAAAPGLWL